jgi:hypothetical protein
VAAGQKGLLDFIGYSVGLDQSAPNPGFVGLLDFTGIPVGNVGAPPVVAEVRNNPLLCSVGKLMGER